MKEERARTFVQRCRRHQRICKLTGDQVDEPLYETVGDSNRRKDMKEGEDR